MNYGFIYRTFQIIIEGLRYLSLVELFKFIALKLRTNHKNKTLETTYRRVAVDIFILFKWSVLILFFIKSYNSLFHCLIIWYFIITNIHTYFYYHIWNEKAIKSIEKDEHSLRRRFINLLLAIAFSNISFAYLYFTYYSSGFNWGVAGIKSSHAIWYSISNSVAANYAIISPIDDLSNSISMIQLLITFVFVAIIISRSIPQKN